jgi:hypothetical protein
MGRGSPSSQPTEKYNGRIYADDPYKFPTSVKKYVDFDGGGGKAYSARSNPLRGRQGC